MDINGKLTWTTLDLLATTDSHLYAATSNEWRYVIDQPYVGGTWNLRGWGPDCRFLCREGLPSLAGTMLLADEHAAMHD